MQDSNTPNYPAEDTQITTTESRAFVAGDRDSARRNEFKSIGHGRRWYDRVYRVLRILQYSWLGKRLPTSWRHNFYSMSHYLLQVNEAQRLLEMGPRRWDGPLELPDDEHVSIPGIWVVDYFPPSLISSLDNAVKRNHWDSKPRFGWNQSNEDTIRNSRRGSGAFWWRIAAVASAGAGFTYTNDAFTEKLPKEFLSVELHGVSIGEGVTAVIAQFRLSPHGYSHLDETWHAKHKPSVARQKGQLAVAEGERWTGWRQTQEARNNLHQLARNWLKSRCPGAFAQSSQHQPLMDLILLDKFDPSTGEEMDREATDCLRALGLTESHIYRQTSTGLPGLILERSSRDMTIAIQDRTWAVWGNRETVITKGSIRVDLYGDDPNLAISCHVDDRMSDYFVRLGLTEFLELQRADSATMRDSARIQHGKFGRRDLKRLRQRFLTASLDFSSIEGDIRQYNTRRWRDREACFVLDVSPWLRKADEEAGREPFKAIQLNKDMRKRQIKSARELVAFDRSYREILSTVASLGASIDSYKVQRYAIWIAIGSAVVAVGTLWITVLGPAETEIIVRRLLAPLFTSPRGYKP